MQHLLKLFLVFFFSFTLNIGLSNNYLEKIQKADRLFQQKKYTESLDLYESLFRNEKIASANMLLKMAFIYEGLHDYTKALFYLNLYYQTAPNNETLVQMESLANQHRLKGYEHSDLDFIRAVYQRYFIFFAGLVVLVCGLIFIYMIYRRMNHSEIPIRYKIAFILALIGIFVWLNFGDQTQSGIIGRDETYLMSAPSAGAELIKKIEKGHKVSILGKEDIWYKIFWENQTVFVRENNILVINQLSH